MIQQINFKIVSPNREFAHFCADQFPYVCLYEPMERHVDKTISWHWHPSYEVVYVAQGELECSSPDQKIHLREGDAVFVNAGVLHQYRQISQAPCASYAHIFDASFLVGSLGSSIYQKYIYPISKSPDIQLQAIRPNNHLQCLMLEHLQTMVTLAQQEPSGYEFHLQHQLSQFWCRLLTLTADRQSVLSGHPEIDTRRIKMMLDFIHKHYTQPLTLKDIADSARISERECSRCFQRYFQESAVHYLHKYRIRAAAQMLLESDMSIAQISQICGFCSASYFGRRFQEFFNLSPRQYRRNKPPTESLSTSDNALFPFTDLPKQKDPT